MTEDVAVAPTPAPAPALAPGAELQKNMSAAGFTPEEITDWQAKQRVNLSAAGFAPHEVDSYFGTLEPDMKPVAQLVQKNFSIAEANRLRDEAVKFGFGQAIAVGQAAVQPAETPEEMRAKSAFDAMSTFGVNHALQIGSIAATPLTAAEARARARSVMGLDPEPRTVGPKPVLDFTEALSQGLQMSVSGLLARGTTPNLAMPADPTMAERVAAGAGQMIGDLPFMVAGSIVGGGPASPVTAGAGAFGLPAGLRATLMDAYAKGDFQNFPDWYERASGIIWDTVKGEVTGAATAAAGGATLAKLGTNASAVGPIVPLVQNQLGRSAAATAAEMATMTTVGSALEGHVPKATDFIDGAILLGGMKAAHVATGVLDNAENQAQAKAGFERMSQKLRDIYAQTGFKPDEVMQAAQMDPTIAADLLSTNQEIPRGLDPHYGELSPVLQNIRREPIFYSELKRQIDGLKLNAAPADQWLSTITQLKGVKRDEIDATGLREYLELAGAAGRKVAKTDVQQFLATNGVTVREQLMGERQGEHLTPDALPEGWSVEQTDAGVKRGEEPPMHFGIAERNGAWHVTDSAGTRAESFGSREEALAGAWELYDSWHGIDSSKGVFFQVRDNEGLSRGIGRNPQDAVDDMLTSPSAREELGIPEYKDPKYSRASLSLPGLAGEGDNYRELVITLPERTVTREETEGLVPYDTREEAELAAARRRERLGTDVSVRATPEGRFELVTRRDDTESANFFGDHYGIPNNLAHTRFSFRTDADGRRVLFVEELQSDWAEQGRNRGFKISTPEMRAQLNALQAEHDATNAQLTQLRGESHDAIAARSVAIRRELREMPARDLTPEQSLHASKLRNLEEDLIDLSNKILAVASGRRQITAMDLELAEKAFGKEGAAKFEQMREAFARRHRISGEMHEVVQKHGEEHPPKAPFVVKTEAWVGLLLKRLIRYASENGFDRVAWTTGDQQNKRYSLSGHVENLEWVGPHGGSGAFREIRIQFKNPVRNDPDQTTLEIGTDGKVQNARGALEDELQGHYITEIIGADLATKIMDEEHGQLEGKGLEVGGRGMREFYDKIVPNVANDVLKKLGGGRVGTVTLPLPKRDLSQGTGPMEPAAYFEPKSDASVSYRPFHTPDGWVIQKIDTDGIPGRFFGGAEEGWTAGTPLATKYAFEKTAIDAIATYRARAEEMYVKGSPQLGFDVTPMMVEKAMAGQPLFNIDRAKLRDMQEQALAHLKGYYGEGERVSALQTLRRLTDRLDSGEWTRERFENEVRQLLGSLERKREREVERDSTPRVRGAAYIEERLLNAVRKGHLDENEAKVARWLLEQNPKLADQLGMSIRTPNAEEFATGQYNPVAKLITLFKGAGSGTNTIVHEILHHSERMLPEGVRQGITEEWAARYARALTDARKAGHAARVDAFETMADAFEGKQGAQQKLMRYFKNGTLQYEDYALVNPSEFWAVHGSRILAARHGADTWAGKAKQWYRELIQQVKEHLGLASDAPVLRALKAAMEVSGEMPKNVLMMAGRRAALGDGETANIPRTPEEQAVLDRIAQKGRAPWWKDLTFNHLYTKIIDRLYPIKMAVDKAGASTTSMSTIDPYRLERLTAGVFGKGAQFINHGTFDFDTYKTTGIGYHKIMDMLMTIGPSGEKVRDLDGFRAYMVARRAIELEARGIQHGVPIPEAQAVVASGQERFETVFQARLQYRAALLDYLEKSGIISGERRTAMEAANAAYVPFYRFFEEESRGTTSRQVRNPIKAIKGSERQIIDPIESDIKDTFLFINLAEKNEARKAMVAMGAPFATKVPVPARPIALTEAELQRYLDDNGIPASASGTTMEIFRAMRTNPARDEIVVFEGGKPATYRVNPDVAEAFNATDRSTASILSAMLTAPASLLRAGVTLSPDFFPRNLLRDALDAFIYAGSNPIKTAKGMVSIVKQDSAFQSWMKAGGANATMVSMDRNYIRAHLFELNAETSLSERAWNVARLPVEILRIVSEVAEAATRVGMVRDQLRDAKTKAQMQALAYISREGTVDFARHGSDPMLTKYTHMVAFMNPGIQGIDRMFRAMADNPAGTIAKSFMAITIPSLLLWWNNRDDKRVQQIPRWERDLFWIVPTKDHIFRIPKPFELGALFGTLPERLMEEFVAKNPDAMKDIDKSLMNAFGVNLIPTAVQPAIEQFANRNLFTGHSLVSATEEKLLPEYQYNVYTTELAKKLGQMFGQFPGMKKTSLGNEGELMPGVARALTNPTLIENYVRAWTGGLGTYAMKIADAGLRKAGALPDPVQPTDTLADVPFVKAFVVRYPSSSAEPIQSFYDTYNGHKQVWDTIMAMAEQGDAGAVQRELQFDPASAVQLTGIRSAIGDHAKLIRNVYRNPDMKPDEKRQLIDTMYMRMIEMAEAGNTMFREVEQQQKQAQQAQAQMRQQLKGAGFSDAEVEQYMKTGAH